MGRDIPSLLGSPSPQWGCGPCPSSFVPFAYLSASLLSKDLMGNLGSVAVRSMGPGARLPAVSPSCVTSGKLLDFSVPGRLQL